MVHLCGVWADPVTSLADYCEVRGDLQAERQLQQPTSVSPQKRVNRLQGRIRQQLFRMTMRIALFFSMTKENLLV